MELITSIYIVQNNLITMWKECENAKASLTVQGIGRVSGYIALSCVLASFIS